MARISGTGPGRERLEDLSTEQLYAMFAYYAKRRPAVVPSSDLADAWGLFFSGLYLSAEELLAGMQGSENRLPGEREQVLREFIHADCQKGGSFVIAVTRNGGKIDRAALIMVADLPDLAAVETHGTTALHLLAAACDRRSRPALIMRAGKKALSGFFDARGMPVLFTILGLSDLAREDLDAIGKVFSRDELRGIKSRSRAGRNGLQMFAEAERRLKTREPADRNAFSIPRAVKNTNMRGELGSQMQSRERGGHDAHLAGRDVMGGNRCEDSDSMQGAAEKYDEMMRQPLDNIRGMVKRGGGTR